MTPSEAKRCIESIARYLETLDDSPWAARDLRKAVKVLTKEFRLFEEGR